MEVENLQTIYNKIKMAAKWIENAKKLLKQNETEILVLREDNKLLKKEIETLKNDRNQNVDFYKNLEMEVDNILSLLPDSLFESNGDNGKENHQKTVNPALKNSQTITPSTNNQINTNANKNIVAQNLIDTNEPTFDFDLDSDDGEEEKITNLPKGVL